MISQKRLKSLFFRISALFFGNTFYSLLVYPQVGKAYIAKNVAMILLTYLFFSNQFRNGKSFKKCYYQKKNRCDH